MARPERVAGLTRELIPNLDVVPAQARTHTAESRNRATRSGSLPSPRNLCLGLWVPACAGTTAEFAAHVSRLPVSQPLFEEQVRIGIVVEARDLAPAAGPVELAGLGQRAVGVEPQQRDAELARRTLG